MKGTMLIGRGGFGGLIPDLCTLYALMGGGGFMANGTWNGHGMDMEIEMDMETET